MRSGSGISRTAVSPESRFFASTAQAFLDRQASVGQLRRLHTTGISFRLGSHPVGCRSTG
jgi:hypothetical protein